MKQINGKLVVEAQLVVNFEFSEDEVNRVLSMRSEVQADALRDILSSKHPSGRASDYVVECFKKAVAEALVTQRENQLRQIEDKPAVSGEEVGS